MPNRPNRAVLALCVAVVIVASCLVAGCAEGSSATLQFTGRVDVDQVNAEVPGFALSASEPESPAQMLPNLTVATTTVRQGDHVKTGQVIATLDARQVRAAASVAVANAELAASAVPVLTNKIGEVADSESELTTKLDELRAQRTTLRAKRSQAPPPARPAIDAALAKLNQAEAQLSDGVTRLHDARTKLENTRELARLAAQSATTAVTVSEQPLTLTEIRAPAAGRVERLATEGQLLATGATVATIRKPSTTVTTWVPPAQVATVCPGGQARVRGDWMPAGQTLSATITRIATSAQYPPSNQASADTHLIRAVKVTATLRAAPDLPAGAPVDITITRCQTGERP